MTLKNGKTPNYSESKLPIATSLLLGNCFWREGLEVAFGPERMGEKGGCGGKRGGKEF